MPLQFDGQLSRFDITIPKANYFNWEELSTKLHGWCNKFAFQLEEGESGYLHWQCRINLIHKKTCSAMLSEVVPAITGHFTPTSNGVHSGPKSFNYVMKEDTRVEGPYDDTMVPVKRVMTIQLSNFYQKEPYQWQQKLRDIADDYDERKLHYIWDPHYNSGKSVFCESLEYENIAEEIPGIFTLAEDIMQFVMSMPVSKCYTFDMPAAMKKEKMSQMYTALEMLKNGFLFDKRYSGKKRRIDRPGVIVFANNLPKLNLMAPDRWAVWYINPKKELEIYDPSKHEIL